MHSEEHEAQLWAVVLGDAPERASAVRQALADCDACSAFAAEVAADLPQTLAAAGADASAVEAAQHRLDTLFGIDEMPSTSHLSLIREPALAEVGPPEDSNAPVSIFSRRAVIGSSLVAAAAAVFFFVLPSSAPTTGVKGRAARLQLHVDAVEHMATVDIEQGLNAVSAPLRACVGEREGKATFQFTIDRQGRVKEATPTAGERDVTGCMLPPLKTATFTPPDEVATSTVTLHWMPPS